MLSLLLSAERYTGLKNPHHQYAFAKDIQIRYGRRAELCVLIWLSRARAAVFLLSCPYTCPLTGHSSYVR